MAKKKRKDKEKIKFIAFLIAMAFLVLISTYSLSDDTLSPEQQVIGDLEEEGYEVLEVGPYHGGYVEMKSLGNREEQVWEGILALARAYPETYPKPEGSGIAGNDYTVWILEPTQKCYYSTAFSNFNSWMKTVLEGEEMYDVKVYVDENGQLDGLNFDRVVELANEHFNQEQSQIQNSFWNRYVENYPEVDGVFLYSLVKYQVMNSERCE